METLVEMHSQWNMKNKTVALAAVIVKWVVQIVLTDKRKRYYKNVWKSSLLIWKDILSYLKKNVRINIGYLSFGKCFLKNFFQTL